MVGITERLKERLEERKLAKLRKYGVEYLEEELMPTATTDFLDGAIDETLDLAMHLMALKEKLDART